MIEIELTQDQVTVVDDIDFLNGQFPKFQRFNVTLFINESEMQEFSKQIAKLFWSKATKEEMDQFIECSFVPQYLVKDVMRYLRNFEDTEYVVLSYSRLLLQERYKL